MSNEEVRTALRQTGVRQWMVAETMGINESIFSRKLRRELLPQEKAAVLKTIEKLAEKLEND